MMDRTATVQRYAPRVKWVSIGIIVLALILIVRLLPLERTIQALDAWLDGLGWWGPVAFGLRIPPTYSVAEVVGYIKGKSAIAVVRQFGGRKRNFNGEAFWARGYAVSTVGFEEDQIRRYIRDQQQLDGQVNV